MIDIVINLITKNVAKDKVDAMVQNLGYPDWIMDDDKFKEYFTGINPTPHTFLENRVSYNKWHMKQIFRKMIEPEPRDSFLMPPTVVNACYSPELNSISMKHLWRNISNIALFI